MALNFLNNGYFAGKVGIGVETPTYTLELQVSQPDENPVVYSQFGGNNGVTGNSFLQIGGARGSAADERYSYLQTLDGAGGFRILSLNPSGGNVGIGTNNPDRKLHVKDVNIVVSEFEGTNTGSLIDLVNSNSSQLYNGIRFTQGTTSKMAITHIADGTTKGYIQIGNSWATGSEILVVDGRTSNVGIGTTSPDRLLSLYSNNTETTPRFLIEQDGTGDAVMAFSLTGGQGWSMGIDNSFSDSFMIHNSAGGVDSSSQFTINTSGNIGIGTTSPGAKLHVNSSDATTVQRIQGATNSALEFYNSSTKTGAILVNSTQFLIAADNSNYLNINTGGSERMRITSSGNVGIGTTSPGTKLHIVVPGGSSQLTLERTGAAAGKVVLAGAAEGLIVYDDVYGAKMYVGTAGTYNGNVGIGTITPSQKLHVAGNLRVTGAYYDSNNSPGTANQVLVSTVTGTDWIDGSAIPGVPAGSGTTNYLAKWTPDGDTLGIGSVFDNGNVGIGSTNPATKFVVQHTDGGSGIEFSMGANLNYIQSYNRATSDYIALKFDAEDIRFGTNNGSERMRIDSGGNVGIGTTSPSTFLQVSGQGNRAGGNIQMGLSSQGANKWSYLTGTHYNSTTEPEGFALIGGYSDIDENRVVIGGNIWETNPATSIHFWTHSSSTHTQGGSQKMVINSDGDVGIGTTSLTNSSGYNTLSINGTTGGQIAFQTSGTGKHYIYSTATDFNIYNSQAGNLKLYTNSTERLRINSNGNVAIGTTASTYRLQVEQDNDGNLLSRFHNTAANGQGLLIRAGGVSSANRILQLASENDTKVMTVNSNGRVGIGIANPTEKLDVVGNIKITAALLSNQENTDVDTGTETVASVAIATYTAAFFDFVIKKTTNVRSGTVYACHDGTNVEFTETSTQDLGDTSDVTLSVDISGTDMRLRATTTSDDWSVKSLIRAI